MLRFCCSLFIKRDGLMLIFDSNVCAGEIRRLFLMTMFAQEHFPLLQSCLWLSGGNKSYHETIRLCFATFLNNKML